VGFFSSITWGSLWAEALSEALQFCSNEIIRSQTSLCIKLVDQKLSPSEIRQSFGNRVLARESVFCAITLANNCVSGPLKELLDNCRLCGGDVDSICAMACAIWGAKNGAQNLPIDFIDKLEARDVLELAASRLILAHRLQVVCMKSETFI
jgi:ADP-ribosylglycohydrolase